MRKKVIEAINAMAPVAIIIPFYPALSPLSLHCICIAQRLIAPLTASSITQQKLIENDKATQKSAVQNNFDFVRVILL